MPNKMNKTINNTVPFDPGFAPFVLTFSTTYFYIENEVKKVKNAGQRKSKYKSFESGLLKICDNIISFYLGGMLYGAYLNAFYKNSPKKLIGNDFLGLNVSDCEKGDVSIEVFTVEKFIKNNDKNPFATKKINPKYVSVIDSYIEFLKINNYFTTVENTSDIKVPKSFEYILNFNNKELNVLYNTLIDSINSKKIEKLLLSNYFNDIQVLSE